MMNAVELVDLIEQYDYVGKKQIGSLRQHLSSSSKKTSSKEIVKLLLEKKHITKYQAKRLLGFAQGTATPKAGDRRASTQPEDDDEIVKLGDDMLEGAVPLDDLDAFSSTETTPTGISSDLEEAEETMPEAQ